MAKRSWGRSAARIAGRSLPYLKQGFKAYKSYTKSSSLRKRGTADRGITQQHDSINVYRKRKMPAGKKRVWKRKLNDFKYMNTALLGTQTVLFNDASDSSTPYQPAGPTFQTLSGCCLMGAMSNSSTADPGPWNAGWKDLQQIYANDGALTATSVAMMTSMILDTTVTNVSSPGTTLEVDVYHIKCRTQGMTTSQTSNPQDYFDLANGQTALINGAGQGLAIEQRGTSPFEFPAAIRAGGWQIISKQKKFLGSNQCFTMQIRRPGNFYINFSRYDFTASGLGTNMPSYIPGKTEFYLFIAKPVPGNGIASNTQLLKLGTTRIYKYKLVRDGNEARDQNI